VRILTDQAAGALRDQVLGSAALADARYPAVGFHRDDKIALIEQRIRIRRCPNFHFGNFQFAGRRLRVRGGSGDGNGRQGADE
jgi:hypothetical protein